MSSPSYETKVRPAGWWYAVVAALWIASAIVFVVLFIRPVVDILSTDLTAFANGDPVSVGSDGISVYVEDDDRVGACTMTGESGSSIPMKTLDLSSDFQVETTGPTMTPHASSPDNVPPGTYAIECAGGNSTILATGQRIDEDSLYTGIGISFLISLILGGLGLALLIVLLVRRHNSKNRIRAAQAAAYYGAWPQHGYDPYGQQQQQGYDPYGQQQQQGYDPYGQQQQDYYGQQPAQPPSETQGGYPPPPPATEPYGGYPAPGTESSSESSSSPTSDGGPGDSGSSPGGSNDSDNR